MVSVENCQVCVGDVVQFRKKDERQFVSGKCVVSGSSYVIVRKTDGVDVNRLLHVYVANLATKDHSWAVLQSTPLLEQGGARSCRQSKVRCPSPHYYPFFIDRISFYLRHYTSMLPSVVTIIRHASEIVAEIPCLNETRQSCRFLV